MTFAPIQIANILGGGWQVIIVLLVVLLLFGHRLPEMMRSLGKSVTEFKKGINETEDEAGDPSKKIDKS